MSWSITTRFQIEFCFRDAKQFVGLTDCQACDTRKLDFAFNSSVTAVNVEKIMCSEYNLSIGRLKALMIKPKSVVGRICKILFYCLESFGFYKASFACF